MLGYRCESSQGFDVSADEQPFVECVVDPPSWAADRGLAEASEGSAIGGGQGHFDSYFIEWSATRHHHEQVGRRYFFDLSLVSEDRPHTPLAWNTLLPAAGHDASTARLCEVPTTQPEQYQPLANTATTCCGDAALHDGHPVLHSRACVLVSSALAATRFYPMPTSACRLTGRRWVVR
jgi:hypothetical protein